MKRPEALYIHIPFCRKRCAYCAFFSSIYDEHLASRYADVLCKELSSIPGQLKSIYVGGGTPTVLSPDLLKRLVERLSRKLTAGAEFTFEANPESTTRAKLAILRRFGVNRLSIGFQSIYNNKLSALGRIHDSKTAMKALDGAIDAGFKNISIDLIFGLWNESIDYWERELSRAARLPITHISCYNISYEKGSALSQSIRRNTLKPLDEETSALFYKRTIDILNRAGFKQYEISSFAKKGFECRHNLSYWENNEYYALGPSSVSYIDGVRAEWISDIEEYCRRIENNTSVIKSRERLTPLERAKETAAFKIRTMGGINFEWFREKTGYDFTELENRPIERLLKNGLIRLKKKRAEPIGISLTKRGIMLCDTVSSELL